MKGKIKKYVQRGLLSSVLGVSFLAGCNDNIYHEVFRNDEQKNMAPLADVVEIDYSNYDKEKQFEVINERAYLKEDSAPKPVLEEIVDVPQPTRYKIPAINASYIEDSNNGLILQYKSRLPAKDLKKLVGKYLENIDIDVYENQNTLIFNGKKQAFGNFKTLTNLLNEFDLPSKQVRMKLSIVEYFNDNTYDRDLTLKALKDSMNIINLELPSSSDPTVVLDTGIDINPTYNVSQDKYTVDSAIKFLDSHGQTKVLSDIDVLVSNGKTVTFSNITSVPYPELLEGKTGWVETIKYRDTGTNIKMTPFANEQGFITVKLEEAKSGEQTGYVGKKQRPVFREADLESEVVLKNGLTYFAGTSLFTRYKKVERGIPLINQVPILKEIFSSKEIEKSQSQLLYFIEARTIDRDSLVGTQAESKVKEKEEVSLLEEVGSEEESIDIEDSNSVEF